MYIAIHDEETTYVGVTNRDKLFGQEEDAVLEENLSLAKGKRGSGIMVFTTGSSAASDMFLEKAKNLSGELTAEKMFREIEPMVRECHKFYSQEGKNGVYTTGVLVASKDALFEIYGSVVQSDFISSEKPSVAQCAYLTSEGKPATERILFIFREIERMNNQSLFPISIYDLRTCKRKIYRK